ncbi:translation initiation factor IF-2 subunit gamma [Candidatus Woesearchaeota archaeon]|nr:translation initiation factor IF-2 subunit gamma [Candidatus Woesearchaeota archaeon]
MKKNEVIIPEATIGMVGHIDHGKTSLTRALTGKWTSLHTEELKRGITIKLGYADATFYKCPKCKNYEAYSVSEKCQKCKSKCELLRKISFVDAPGHETLMATMLSGAALMDGVILLVAANEPCPQPQTKEHLMALDIMGIKNIIIAQNKVDIVNDEQALKSYKEIQNFVKATVAENAPIIPISAQHNVNVDVLVYALENIVKTQKIDETKDPVMFIARSFDLNKPGDEIADLKGGVLGGSLKCGVLKEGDEIEICPGIESTEHKWKPIITKIIGLAYGKDSVKTAKSGGTFGLKTELDPSLVKADKLIGNVVGLKGKTSKAIYEADLEPHLLTRVVGTKEELKVEPLKLNEPLMLNVNTTVTVGIINKIEKKKIHVILKIPVCAQKDDRVTISRNLGGRWRLIGYANFL